jgi:hypothetical protein
MDPDDEFANTHPLLNCRSPFLPPTTPEQAIGALLSPDTLASSLLHPVPMQPGLGAMLGYEGPSPKAPSSLGGALLQHGVTSLPGSDPRLVNISTDAKHPAYVTPNGTTINVNKAAPPPDDPKGGTSLPWGEGMDRLTKLADATGLDSITLTGGTETGHKANNHQSNLAVDLRLDPRLTADVMKKAALAAGYTHVIPEADHWHLQVGPQGIKGDPDRFDVTLPRPLAFKSYTDDSPEGDSETGWRE